MSETTAKTITVRADSRPAIETRFRALNRRAERHGLAPVRLTWAAAEPHIRREEISGRVTITDQLAVTFEAAPLPTFAGWRLIAALDRIEDVNIIRAVPGAPPVPESYRTADRCDVCRTSRRRLTLYACQHDDGGTKLVGSNCLSLLVPGADVDALICSLDIQAEIGAMGDDDNEGGGSRGESALPLSLILQTTAEVLCILPWISRTQARDRDDLQATADTVDRLLNPHPACDKLRREVREAVAGKDLAPLAEAAAEWAAAITPTSDYEHNIQTVARIGYVRNAHLGIACSILPAYRRHIANSSPTTPGAYVGRIGERLKKITATLDAVYVFESYYGTKAVVKLRDAAGNTLVSFTSPITDAPGTKFQLSGTVKKHEDYRGVRQTVLSRMTLQAG